MQINCELITLIVILIADPNTNKGEVMNQENKVSTEVEVINQIMVDQDLPSSKKETLAMEIMRTAKPVDLAQFRLTPEDIQKVETFVEIAVTEQFRSYGDGPRAFFKLDGKVLSKQIEAFVRDQNGLAGVRSKETQAQKLAKELAIKWENYFKYSEIIQTWAKSYLEFKQSFR